MSETASPGARYRIGAYRFWHRHVARREDPVADAHTLLAPLAAEHARTVRAEVGDERLRAAVLALADAFTG